MVPCGLDLGNIILSRWNHKAVRRTMRAIYFFHIHMYIYIYIYVMHISRGLSLDEREKATFDK